MSDTAKELELYRETMQKVCIAMEGVLTEDEYDMLLIAREAGGSYWVDKLRAETEARDASRTDGAFVGVE